MITFNTRVLKENPTYSIRKNLFSIEECEGIISLFQKLPLNNSLTAGGFNSFRSSKNVWIPFDHTWIYERIAAGSKECNPWGIDVNGFKEMIQLTMYGQDDYYNYHVDFGIGDMSLRKISCVIQLSDPANYHGGELDFLLEKKNDFIKEQGTAIFFPSFVAHRVCRLISGIRYSAVVWISGETFR